MAGLTNIESKPISYMLQHREIEALVQTKGEPTEQTASQQQTKHLIHRQQIQTLRSHPGPLRPDLTSQTTGSEDVFLLHLYTFFI